MFRHSGATFVNLCNLELQHSTNSNYKSVGDRHMKYALGLRHFDVNKIPEGGILVPKHLAVAT